MRRNRCRLQFTMAISTKSGKPAIHVSRRMDAVRRTVPSLSSVGESKESWEGVGVAVSTA